MDVDDAIELARENVKRKRCDCLDCRALNVMADEIERLREERRTSETPTGATRTVDEILVGDALTWAAMKPADIRHEHELLRRSLQSARAQIALWSPIVAGRHRCPRCQDTRLECPSCGDPWATQGVLK